MGLLNRAYADVEGQILFEGRDLLKLTPAELRGVRGKDVSMIFQDPFACLHPMYRVGDQIAEAVLAHQKVRSASPGRAPSSCSTRSGSRTPRSGPATIRTSSPAGCASAR